MKDLIYLEKDKEFKSESQTGVSEVTEKMLADVRKNIDKSTIMSIPIAELSTLGAGVSSLIPAFNTVTQTTTIAAKGLFRVANAAAGDSLKMAKNGNAWGALKTAAGGSKMAQLAEAGPISATTKSVVAFNPGTMLMAAALYSIEKQLKNIEEMQRQILSQLEIKEESDVEGDLETLTELVNNYKYNWDNQIYVQNSHKMVMDIKRTARSSMIAYQKKVNKIISYKKLFVAKNHINSVYSDLVKKFQYYRLALYTYSLASMMEIMLGGNYKEEYITGIKNEVRKLTEVYRTLFEKGSLYLEKIGASSVEANVLRGIGTAGNTVGKWIGGIPFVKEGPVDEFLQNQGTRLKKNAIGMEKGPVYQFAAVSNPGTGVFMEKMEDIIQIYNHTRQIYFDSREIYLVSAN